VHELSVAEAILEAVREEAGDRRPVRVGIKVGAISGVDPESLQFCFDALVEGSPDAPLALEIEAVPWRQRCPACSAEFEVVDLAVACPDCGEVRTECAAGHELTLSWLAFAEEPGSATPGRDAETGTRR
jgi:hydrogenase nickel incorporation protein HypA/HybF